MYYICTTSYWEFNTFCCGYYQCSQFTKIVWYTTSQGHKVTSSQQTEEALKCLKLGTPITISAFKNKPNNQNPGKNKNF